MKSKISQHLMFSILIPHFFIQSRLPRIKFYTGRKDCTEFGDEPYKATKHESHPNAVGSGKMTADFFEAVRLLLGAVQPDGTSSLHNICACGPVH